MFRDLDLQNSDFSNTRGSSIPIVQFPSVLFSITHVPFSYPGLKNPRWQTTSQPPGFQYAYTHDRLPQAPTRESDIRIHRGIEPGGIPALWASVYPVKYDSEN